MTPKENQRYRILRYQDKFYIEVYDGNWCAVTVFGYALIDPIYPFSYCDLCLPPFYTLQDAKDQIDRWITKETPLDKPDEIIEYPATI